MSTSKAQSVLQDYESHTTFIHHFVDGISHEESVMQLPFKHNCMNWILGHIVNNRSHVLESVGAAHDWQAEVRGLYHTGTSPIRPESKSVPFGKLIEHLDQSVVLLRSALETMTDTQLDETHSNYRGEKSRYKHVTDFHWHETFHVGQLEILAAFIESNR